MQRIPNNAENGHFSKVTYAAGGYTETNKYKVCIVQICIYVYIYIYMNMYIYINMYTYLHICIYTYMLT
jgi:hypothetical protein